METTTTPTAPETPAPAATAPRPYHIVSLEIANVKRIKTARIIPNGNIVPVTGKNDQGKTSCLDSIVYVLGGKDAVCERPIRDGASKAHVVADLGDLVVTRKWTASGGSTLTVTAKDGTPIKSPQAFLDGLCAGGIGFDPLSFTRMTPREQLETLRSLVGLDFTVFDQKRDAFYSDRTLVNRDLETAKGKLASYPDDPATPAEEVSIATLTAELTRIGDIGDAKLQAARSQNAENQRVRDERKNMERQIASADQGIAGLEIQLRELERAVAGAKTVLAQAKKDREDLGRKEEAIVKAVADLKDEDEQAIRNAIIEARKPVQSSILDADNINTKVRARKRRVEIQKEIEAHQLRSNQLTTAIEGIDLLKRKALEDAKFPLPGLSFNDSGVLLNGVPFSQGSQARQLQASVAIGLALNPRIRVVIIRDGSLLDDDSMKLVAEMAEQSDAQIWIERVGDDGGPGSIVIEDGEVRA